VARGFADAMKIREIPIGEESQMDQCTAVEKGSGKQSTSIARECSVLSRGEN